MGPNIESYLPTDIVQPEAVPGNETVQGEPTYRQPERSFDRPAPSITAMHTPIATVASHGLQTDPKDYPIALGTESVEQVIARFENKELKTSRAWQAYFRAVQPS